MQCLSVDFLVYAMKANCLICIPSEQLPKSQATGYMVSYEQRDLVSQSSGGFQASVCLGFYLEARIIYLALESVPISSY